MPDEDTDDLSDTRRGFLQKTVAAVLGTKTLDTLSTDAGATEQDNRKDPLQEELEEYVDATSRERLWSAFGYEPDFDTIETKPATGATQLVTYEEDGSGKVSHIIGPITGYDENEQAYIDSKAEAIAELYKQEPNLYAETTDDPGQTEVQRVSGRTDPDLDADEQKAIDSDARKNLDEQSRTRLWTYFSDHPGADDISVQDIGNHANYQLTLEEQKDDQSPASVYALSDVTGFSPDEQEYIKNNLEELHNLYLTDPTRYLETADNE